jgi:phospholipid/cholesterol/gamma-HCH transport system substrate-binding protein
MRQNIVETIIGFIVVLITISFFTYSYTNTSHDNNNEYFLNATFQNVDGIIKGSDVKIGGIIIGRVESLDLDEENYNALVKFAIHKEVKIPADSSASISSSGFLGGKFVSISPGGDEEYINENGEIKYTQSSVNLESLIGKFMYSGKSGSSGSDSK